jgi:hypothetical protein
MYKLFLVIFVIYIIYHCYVEQFGNGALLQLSAKGPQDTYLTNDAYRHNPFFYGWRQPLSNHYYNSYYPQRYNYYNYPSYGYLQPYRHRQNRYYYH